MWTIPCYRPTQGAFLSQDYEGDITVDGMEYEVRFCETDFCLCDLFHLANLPASSFYILFDQAPMKDQTMWTYQKMKKKYVVLGVDDKEEAA